MYFSISSFESSSSLDIVFERKKEKLNYPNYKINFFLFFLKLIQLFLSTITFYKYMYIFNIPNCYHCFFGFSKKHCRKCKFYIIFIAVILYYRILSVLFIIIFIYLSIFTDRPGKCGVFSEMQILSTTDRK